MRSFYSSVKRRFSSSTAAALSTQTANRARVLVVGCGRMGDIRASIVHSKSRFELLGIVDKNIDSAKSLANKLGVASFDSLSYSINETQPDGVIISTPTHTHDSLIREIGGIKNSKNSVSSIFVEKPVDESADRITALYSFAEKRGIQLCCGFQRRFDASYMVAATAVKNGAVGKPVMSNLFFADHPVPQREFLLSGGNIFMDLAVHDIDYIVYTLQDSVKSVYATGTSSDEELAAAGVHDNGLVVLTFKSGAVATLFMSRFASYGYDQRCEIFGPKGLVSVGNIQEHATTISNESGIHQSRLQYSFPQRFQDAFVCEMDAFADTIIPPENSSSTKPWPVSGAECIQVQRITDAAILSAKTGEIVYL